MRLWWRLARVGFALVIRLPAHAVARLRGRPSRQIGPFLAAVTRVFGVRVRVEGAPLRRDVLYLANHVSWLDIVTLGGVTGAAFVSKDDVARWPVVGWLARQAGTVFIHRQSRVEVQGQADALAAALAGGRPVALFPEGTTSDGRTLLPFRTSLLAALDVARPGIRVQPVAIDYGAAAARIAWTGGEGTGGNVKRVGGSAAPLPVTLYFLPPIDPAETTGRKAIAAAARTAIEAALSASGTIRYSAAP